MRAIKRTVVLFIACLVAHFTFAQFKTNSIGVCYLNGETKDSVFLEIVLPSETLEKDTFYNPSYPIKSSIDSFMYNGQIILFDLNGELFRTSGQTKFLKSFWCENDGGVQYRPTVDISISKVKLRRKLNAIKEIQNICCFVLLNQDKTPMNEPDFKVSKNIKLKGDYNKDARIDCFIWTEEDSAGNCDGEPKNNLDINLQVDKYSYPLRCCGP